MFSGLNIVNEDAYISAISDGMLVGSVSVYGISQTALSVWGDDSSTGAVDGASIGSEVTLQLVDGSSLYTLTTSPEPITYIVNGTQVIMSASASLSCGVTEILGCTDASADNFDEMQQLMMDHVRLLAVWMPLLITSMPMQIMLVIVIIQDVQMHLLVIMIRFIM